MAAIKSGTARKDNGRDLAVRLLERMERVNEGYLVDEKKNRDLVQHGMDSYGALNAAEKRRFVAVLSDYIGSAMQGVVMAVTAYRHSRLEAQSMRISNQALHQN